MLDSNLISAVNAMPRKVSCKLDAGNSNIITDVKRLTYASDWAGTIAVGQVVSSYISATVPTPNFSIAGVNVALSMGIGSTVTWTKIGDFRIDEESVRTKQGYTGFTAYDKLYYAINTYHSSGDKTLQAICNEVCSAIGITSITLTADLTIDSETLDGYTMRDVLGFIAAYQGKNAYLSPNGVLEMRWFTSTAYTADGTRANIPYIGENNCTIRRWICQTQDGVITSGSGEGLFFTCPFMTQARLDSIASSQQLTAYRKADVDIPFGNYLLQSGDIITVTTTGSNLTVPIMSNSWTYDGGVASSVSSYGATDYTGTANNAERSVSAQRVQNILREKKAANRVTEEIKHATDLITGATGGIIRINMGGNGEPAELLILQYGDIDRTPQRVFRLNENGLGYSDQGYDGPYETAITADGLIVTDRFVGNLISGVTLESTENVTNASQALITGGTYAVNRLYNDTVYPIGRLRFIPAAGYYSTDTMALEVEEGKNITIGDTTSPKFIFLSDDDSPDMFRFYGVSTFYDDIHVESNKDIIIEDLNNQTHSLLDKIAELEQRIEVLEQALDNGQ